MQEAGADKVRAMQGGDVLRREAHVEALVGTRERVRGAARAAQVDNIWTYYSIERVEDNNNLCINSLSKG